MTSDLNSAVERLQTQVTEVTGDRIIVRGVPIQDLIREGSYVRSIFLLVRGRRPDEVEEQALNSLLCTSFEHGVNTPALVGRLTLNGAPESLNAAMAAALACCGSRLDGTIEIFGSLLERGASLVESGTSVKSVATRLVKEHLDAGRPVPGIGHPTHKAGDPRTPALCGRLRSLGFDGVYLRLAEAIHREAIEQIGKDLPLNGAAVVAAGYLELGFTPKAAKGLSLTAIAVGVLAHLLEEDANPIANKIRGVVAATLEIDRQNWDLPND